MSKEIIAIIGGPSSGKSTLLKKLEENGNVCYPEISREVIKEAQVKGIEQLFLTQPLLFSEMLLKGRIDQFEQANKELHNLIFIDRGIPDILAYMHYIGDVYPKAFHEACLNYKYTKIFFLPIWKEIYVSDQERYESYEQALEIEKHLIDTYKKYNYNVIEVPKDSVENRMQFIMDNLK